MHFIPNHTSIKGYSDILDTSARCGISYSGIKITLKYWLEFLYWIGRLSKAHKNKEKEKEREKERQRREERERRSSGDEAKHRSSERDGGKDERKRKHRESSHDRYTSFKSLNIWTLKYIWNFHVFLNVSVFYFFSLNCREKPPVKEARRPPAPPSWLQRDLKVRFIDKAFKGGRYYNSKVLMNTWILHLCLLWIMELLLLSLSLV